MIEGKIMGPFDSFFFSEHKYHIIGGIVSIILLICLVIGVKSCGNNKQESLNPDEQTLSESMTSVSSEVDEEHKKVDTEVLSFHDYTMNQHYVIHKEEDLSTHTERVYVTRNFENYGSSKYSYTNDAYIEHDFVTFETLLGMTDEERAIVAPNNLSMEELSDNAVVEGLIYTLNTEDAIKFVNNLIQEGYTIQYKISTSKYTEVYLQDLNEHSDACLRILIPEDKDILIISEIEDITDDNIKLQVVDAEDIYETQS